MGCGFLYGATGPLLRVVATGLNDPRTLFTTWPIYLLAAVGITGYLLNQNAFQAGSLPAPLAVLTILDPVVGATRRAGFPARDRLDVRGRPQRDARGRAPE